MFYFPDISSGHLSIGADETKHIVRVLRKSVGNTVEITDGNGVVAVAELVEVGKRECSVRIIKEVKHENTLPDLTIAIAPTKSIDRFEWFVEKAVEIGVRRIVPLICDNSERKILKEERLEKIAIAAMKQSKNYYLPRIEKLTLLDAFIKDVSGALFVAYCPVDGAEYLLPKLICQAKTTVFVGPEGDFSPREFLLMKNSGCEPVSLGKTRLRTETAGVLACSLVQAASLMK